MLKSHILEFAKKWGYILVYSEYSRKAQDKVWVVKVPTTTFKNRPGFFRTLKILEDHSLEQLSDKIKRYFADIGSPIKVVLRNNKYSGGENDKELFTIE